MSLKPFLVYIVVLGICILSEGQEKTVPCKAGYFQLPGMMECYPYLTCSEMTEVGWGPTIGLGSTKKARIVLWNEFNIVALSLINKHYIEDFRTGLKNLKKLNPSPHVVQLVGYCEEKNVIFTEYHRKGNATIIRELLDKKFGWDNIVERIKLCLNYARILDFLHGRPEGPRVMCDSNDLNKLLSQLLISEELSLILNDVDAVPVIDGSSDGKIKCGKREIAGDFVAPEQKWPFSGPFREAAMPGYDEKTDIWKAADVCNHFVNDASGGTSWIQYRLFNLHKSCKNLDPKERPTAKYLVSVYEKILASIATTKTEL